MSECMRLLMHAHNEPYPKLRHKQKKNSHFSRGTLVIFVLATIGQKYLNSLISAVNEDIPRMAIRHCNKYVEALFG